LNTWNKHRKDIKIREHLRFSKCTTCVNLRMNWKDGTDDVSRAQKKKECTEHLEFVKQERSYLYYKRDLAKRYPNDFLSIIIDGADQSAYSLPHFKEIDKNTSTARKQKSHILGAIKHGRTEENTMQCYLYTISDKWEHGSNQTITLLQKVLLQCEERSKREDGRLPPTLFLQADNCGRENKNRYFLAYLSWLVQKGIFKEIYLSFLPVGHTHEVSFRLFFVVNNINFRCS